MRDLLRVLNLGLLFAVALLLWCFASIAPAGDDWVIADAPPAAAAPADWKIDDAEPIASVSDWVIAAAPTDCKCSPHCDCRDCKCCVAKPTAYSIAYRKAAAAEMTLLVCPFADSPTIDKVQNIASKHGWQFVALSADSDTAKELRRLAKQTDDETRELGIKLIPRNGELWVRPQAPTRVVTLTTSDACVPCRRLKSYLESCGIDCVEQSAAAGETVPVVEYAGRRLVGFDRSALDKLLGEASEVVQSKAPLIVESPRAIASPYCSRCRG